MKQLERLLFLQGNVCFFCQQPIPAGEASIEHLVASANGGAKDDDNCVVCCKTVNAALGSLSVKAKLQAIVNQRSGFACPNVPAKIDALQPATTDDARLKLVVSDLPWFAQPHRIPGESGNRGINQSKYCAAPPVGQISIGVDTHKDKLGFGVEELQLSSGVSAQLRKTG